MTNYEKPVSADFTLSPMSDDFARGILGALDKTNTSKVWMRQTMFQQLCAANPSMSLM